MSDNTDLATQTGSTSLRNRFSSEEWSLVRSAPFAAGLMIAAADPSGIIGSIREATALHHVIQEAAKDAPPASLVALVTDPEQFGPFDDDITITPRSAPETFLNVVQQALAVVAVKTPEAVEAYRRLILSAAQLTAEASKEGGVFGIGGKLVSEEEQAALNQLRLSLSS